MTSVTDRIDRLVGEARDKVQALEHEWILFVRWTDLLLASWPVAAEQVRPLVPGGLDIDTFDNTAWISIVPFNAVDMHFRDLPPIPGQADFCELNLRTFQRNTGARAGASHATRRPSQREPPPSGISCFFTKPRTSV